MGHSVELFIDENIDEEYICTICRDVFKDAAMISACEHIFCNTCIHAWKVTKPTCPICRQRIGILKTPQRAFMNLMGRLQLRCPFTDLGCTSTLKYEDVKQHEERCQANPGNEVIVCPKGCGVSFRKREEEDHVCAENEPSGAGAADGPVAVIATNRHPRTLRVGMPAFIEHGRNIWSGTLVWHERHEAGPGLQELQCSVKVAQTTPPIEITGTNWPERLTLRLVPRGFIFEHGYGWRLNHTAIGMADPVHFEFPESATLTALKTKMSSDSLLGLVQLHNPSKLCVLLHSRRGETDFFVGVIPRNQQALQSHMLRQVQLRNEGRNRTALNPHAVALRYIHERVGTPAAATAAANPASRLTATASTTPGSLRLTIRRIIQGDTQRPLAVNALFPPQVYINGAPSTNSVQQPVQEASAQEDIRRAFMQAEGTRHVSVGPLRNPDGIRTARLREVERRIRQLEAIRNTLTDVGPPQHGNPNPSTSGTSSTWPPAQDNSTPREDQSN